MTKQERDSLMLVSSFSTTLRKTVENRIRETEVLHVDHCRMAMTLDKKKKHRQP
jgi:hypothetical protein